MWFDHRDGSGGGKLQLIQLVNGCSRHEAMVWLAAMMGTTLDSVPLAEEDRQRWRDDQQVRIDSVYFASTARIMAEEALESLPPCDLARREYTSLLHQLDVSPENEYRHWRDRDVRLTNALVHAGRKREARLHQLLAVFLSQECNAAA